MGQLRTANQRRNRTTSEPRARATALRNAHPVPDASPAEDIRS